jgi:hypothetical protein
MSQKEWSIFWEVIIWVILSKQTVYVRVPFRTVSEIQLFHRTVPKLLIRKRDYILFLISVFIVQVTKLVQFTQYNTFSKIRPSTSMHLATRVRTWRVARLYSVHCTWHWNRCISKAVRNSTHVHIYNFLLRMADTMYDFQNTDLSTRDSV